MLFKFSEIPTKATSKDVESSANDSNEKKDLRKESDTGNSDILNIDLTEPPTDVSDDEDEEGEVCNSNEDQDI